jgi:Family of unknown function (DUF6481)
MGRFQQPGLDERLSAAAIAKEAALKRFRARGDVNDSEVLRKRAKRLGHAQARDVRLKERKLARETQDAAELAAREARETTEKAEREEREARERAEQASRTVALEQERKTERDARYAARKVRKLERQKSPFGKFGRR